MLVIFFRLVRILKQSARLLLVVTVGSKHISPPILLASWFLDFLDGVKEMLSWVSPISRGLNLGAIKWIHNSVAVVQACGFLHLRARSWSQSVHGHIALWMCSKWGLCLCKQADVEIRSATVDIECFLRRYSVVVNVSGPISVAGWYHMGNWEHRCGEIQMCAR